MNKQKITNMAMGSRSNGKENLYTSWKTLAKVQVSFSPPWLQDKPGKKIKQKPEMRSAGSPPPQRVIKAGWQPTDLQVLSLSRTSARFWWDISACWDGALLNEAGILRCCPPWSPFCIGFVQVELLFSHRHKGQVKPDAAGVPGPQALFCFKATRTRMLLCSTPRRPYSLSRRLMIGWFCFVPLLFSMGLHFEKELLFTFSWYLLLGRCYQDRRGGMHRSGHRHKGGGCGTRVVSLEDVIRRWISNLQILRRESIWLTYLSHSDAVTSAMHTAEGTTGDSQQFGLL